MTNETLVFQILLGIGGSAVIDEKEKRTLIDAILAGNLNEAQSDRILSILEQDLQVMRTVDAAMSDVE